MQFEPNNLNQLTERVIGAAYQVANTLGAGFLEKVYENALAVELANQRLPFEQQKPIQIHYNGVIVGDYVADFVVDNSIILELKACKQLDSIHMAQCLNYLRATKLKLALLINYGTAKIEIKRIMN